MACDLLHAVSELYIGSGEQISQDEDCIDDKLNLQRPRKRTKWDPAILKKDTEMDFLSPPTSYGPDWLNKVQQYVNEMTAVRIG